MSTAGFIVTVVSTAGVIVTVVSIAGVIVTLVSTAGMSHPREYCRCHHQPGQCCSRHSHPGEYCSRHHHPGEYFRRHSCTVRRCTLYSRGLLAVGQVDVAGSMHFWGLTIDTVTTIILILAIGLAVDYSAHIGHMFMTVTGTRAGQSPDAQAGTDKLRGRHADRDRQTC